MGEVKKANRTFTPTILIGGWYNPLCSIARRIKEMAIYWTSIGVMLIPVGLAILIQWPDYYPTAFIVIVIGFVLGIVGLRLTIKDERQRQIERKKEEERRVTQDKKRIESHYLDTLIQYEILRALGVNPRIVSRKYRSWLSNRKFQEVLRKFEEEEGDEL
jgi:hypothetical protein